MATQAWVVGRCRDCNSEVIRRSLGGTFLEQCKCPAVGPGSKPDVALLDVMDELQRERASYAAWERGA